MLLALVLVGSTTLVQAQSFPGSGEFNGALLKIFGEIKAFTAKADLKVVDQGQKETVTTPADVTLLDERARFDIDLTQMKSANMPPEAVVPLKAAGMARVVTIARPDLKQVLLIYPDAKSLLRMPMPDKDVQTAKADVKVEKTALGKETIDGHACQKTKLILTDATGSKTEATTWNAADLKDFPIQIQTVDKGNTVVIKFREVKFDKPAATLFDAPPGYKEYKNTQDMMQEMMMKMMGGAQGR